MRYRAALIALCVAGLAAACGQRGPLTLPSRGGDATALPDAAQQAGTGAESPAAAGTESPAAADTESPATPDAESPAEAYAESPSATDADSPAVEEEVESDNGNE